MQSSLVKAYFMCYYHSKNTSLPPFSLLMPPIPYRFTKSSFSLRSLIRDLLTIHEQRSFTDFFCAGGSHTTPHLCSIDARWQFPWRSLLLMTSLLFFALFFMLAEHVARIELGNTKLFVSSIVMQSVAIPLGLISLFSELNIWRNQPWLRIIIMVCGGGLLSIIFALLLSAFGHSSSPFMAGIIEEPAKIAAVLLLAGHARRRNGLVLNGMLFGAAVGAGFSIMESIGYAFEALHNPIMTNGSHPLAYQNAYTLMATRSFFFLTAGHATWTAITCGALWHCMRGRNLWRGLMQPSFLFFLVVAIVIHGYWNMSTSTGAIFVMIPLFAICSWGLIAVLNHLGIQQIRDMQQLWFDRHSLGKRCVWLLEPRTGATQGPLTAEETIECLESGNITRKTLCTMGALHCESHSVGKLSFISSLANNNNNSCWYHCKRPFWFIICRILGIASMLSLPCFLYFPRWMVTSYLFCCFALFGIIVSILLKLWQSPNLPTEPCDQYGSLIWIDSPTKALLKFFIPGYNIYWGYLLGGHLIRRVNLLNDGERRIPNWIPQAFWTTFCTGITLASVLLIYHSLSFLPYLLSAVILFPSSAALACVALASAQQTLEEAHKEDLHHAHHPQFD